MTTQWKYRINTICPEGDKNALNALWTVVAPEGNSEVGTFGVPLSADGKEPAAHRGMSTAATEEMRLLIQEVFVSELANCQIEVMPHYLNTWQEFVQENGLQTIEVNDV